MDKTALRKIYKAKRTQILEAQLEEMSLAIANNVLQLTIWEATYYHIFLPITNKKEVNTEYILHILQGKDKSVLVPKTNFELVRMEHILLQENTVIKISEKGIPEPVGGIKVPASQVEVVFMPLLAYDKKGNRLGYGKGFYDRFLEQCSDNIITVGLSFFEPEEEIPVVITDIPLNFVVTPENIIKF